MDPTRGHGRRAHALARWAVVLVSFALFLTIALNIEGYGRSSLDAELLAYLDAHRTPALTFAARALSTVGGAAVVAVMSLVLVVGVALRYPSAGRREARFLAIAVGGSAALNLGVKSLFAWPRPDLTPHLAFASGFTFPSGHAMINASFYLALAILAYRLLPRRWAWSSLLGIVLCLAIGVSRPYLQVHYPSDVLAGWALGSAWVAVASLILPPSTSARWRAGGQQPRGSQHHH